jgi:hypothetical protein
VRIGILPTYLICDDGQPIAQRRRERCVKIVHSSNSQAAFFALVN